MTTTISPNLKPLAKDLANDVPRSPRETLAGYVIAARLLDKCRAHLNGTSGEYNCGKYMDNLFLEFTGITLEQFQEFVATGASDDEVANWITKHSKVTDRTQVVKWNNDLRYATLPEMSDYIQEFFEEYIAENIPANRPVYHVFDIFDIEEGHI